MLTRSGLEDSPLCHPKYMQNTQYCCVKQVKIRILKKYGGKPTKYANVFKIRIKCKYSLKYGAISTNCAGALYERYLLNPLVNPPFQEVKMMPMHKVLQRSIPDSKRRWGSPDIGAKVSKSTKGHENHTHELQHLRAACDCIDFEQVQSKARLRAFSRSQRGTAIRQRSEYTLDKKRHTTRTPRKSHTYSTVTQHLVRPQHF